MKDFAFQLLKEYRKLNKSDKEKQKFIQSIILNIIGITPLWFIEKNSTSDLSEGLQIFIISCISTAISIIGYIFYNLKFKNRLRFIYIFPFTIWVTSFVTLFFIYLFPIIQERPIIAFAKLTLIVFCLEWPLLYLCSYIKKRICQALFSISQPSTPS